MIDVLIEKMKHLLKDRQETLLTGRCQDYTQYKELIATINAIEECIDMAKKVGDEDEEFLEE